MFVKTKMTFFNFRIAQAIFFFPVAQDYNVRTHIFNNDWVGCVVKNRPVYQTRNYLSEIMHFLSISFGINLDQTLILNNTVYVLAHLRQRCLKTH
jgi:hypothetical protein